jgi:glycosyltransferase involved in cell wall biosynthesis
MSGAVAFVLKGYPRLSETFIAQEIRALEKRGLDIRLYSLRHPTDRERHPVHGEIIAPVSYLPEYLHQEPIRVARAWRALRRAPGYAGARRCWLADLRRDRTRNRIRRFGQALVLAHELAPDITHLHAHFLHTPASVTRYAALVRGLKWSCSAHAKDIWTSARWEKSEKLADCAWAVTCTRANFEHLSALAPGGRVHLSYHGLDLTRFPPPPPPAQPLETRPEREGSSAEDPVMILSIGRAVEKKGHDDLLAALARLPETLNWRFELIGGGPLQERLKNQAEQLGIARRCVFRGALAQAAVLDAYRRADLFALMSRQAADGDRDGLPNVLMEAQSQGLAVMATDISAIPELIAPEQNGLLVAPGDIDGAAQALTRLITDAALRDRLGTAGRILVHEKFSLEPCIESLAARFGLAPVKPAPAP